MALAAAPKTATNASPINQRETLMSTVYASKGRRARCVPWAITGPKGQEASVWHQVDRRRSTRGRRRSSDVGEDGFNWRRSIDFQAGVNRALLRSGRFPGFRIFRAGTADDAVISASRTGAILGMNGELIGTSWRIPRPIRPVMRRPFRTSDSGRSGKVSVNRDAATRVM